MTLTDKERRKLVAIVTKGRNKASYIQRAHILLKSADGTIVQNLSTSIHLHLKANRLGRGGPEIRCRPVDDPHITLVPNWSFRLGLDQPVVTDGAVLGKPAFAVEVQSPDEALADLRKKVMI